MVDACRGKPVRDDSKARFDEFGGVPQLLQPFWVCFSGICHLRVWKADQVSHLRGANSEHLDLLGRLAPAKCLLNVLVCCFGTEISDEDILVGRIVQFGSCANLDTICLLLGHLFV